MRILAIDLGDKRVGWAISDPLGITAQGLPTLERKNEEELIKSIHDKCISDQVSECVVGLPLTMKGEIGDRAKKVLEWVEGLSKALDCEVKTWDERLTSKQAERLMISQDLSRKKRKSESDALAAILILQQYLDFKRINKRSVD